MVYEKLLWVSEVCGSAFLLEFDKTQVPLMTSLASTSHLEAYLDSLLALKPIILREDDIPLKQLFALIQLFDRIGHASTAACCGVATAAFGSPTSGPNFRILNNGL